MIEEKYIKIINKRKQEPFLIYFKQKGTTSEISETRKKKSVEMSTATYLRLRRYASLNSLSLLHFHNSPLPTVRCSSSSSSPSSSGNTKPDKKKLGDRLSSVIDSVNDRKLPPELRGQRNIVRYCVIYTIHSLRS